MCWSDVNCGHFFQSSFSGLKKVHKSKPGPEFVLFCQDLSLPQCDIYLKHFWQTVTRLCRSLVFLCKRSFVVNAFPLTLLSFLREFYLIWKSFNTHTHKKKSPNPILFTFRFSYFCCFFPQHSYKLIQLFWRSVRFQPLSDTMQLSTRWRT